MKFVNLIFIVSISLVSSNSFGQSENRGPFFHVKEFFNPQTDQFCSNYDVNLVNNRELFDHYQSASNSHVSMTLDQQESSALDDYRKNLELWLYFKNSSESILASSLIIQENLSRLENLVGKKDWNTSSLKVQIESFKTLAITQRILKRYDYLEVRCHEVSWKLCDFLKDPEYESKKNSLLETEKILSLNNPLFSDESLQQVLRNYSRLGRAERRHFAKKKAITINNGARSVELKFKQLLPKVLKKADKSLKKTIKRHQQIVDLEEGSFDAQKLLKNKRLILDYSFSNYNPGDSHIITSEEEVKAQNLNYATCKIWLQLSVNELRSLKGSMALDLALVGVSLGAAALARSVITASKTVTSSKNIANVSKNALWATEGAIGGIESTRVVREMKQCEKVLNQSLTLKKLSGSFKKTHQECKDLVKSQTLLLAASVLGSSLAVKFVKFDIIDGRIQRVTKKNKEILLSSLKNTSKAVLVLPEGLTLKEEVLKNASLSNIQRRDKIISLYPSLTQKQVDAMIRAHEEVSCAVFNCSYTQLRRKSKILKQAGIPEAIARDSISRGLLGYDTIKLSYEDKLITLFFHQKVVEHAKDGQILLAESDLKDRGIRNFQDPQVKIKAWLESFNSQSKLGKEMFQDFLDNNFITPSLLKRENIKESYFETLQRRLREQGHGDTQIDKDLVYKNIVGDQRDSLLQWISYLASSDTFMYPNWVKVWILKSIIKLTKFNQETSKFYKRRKGDVEAFPELNRDALGEVVEVIQKIVLKQEDLPEIYGPMRNNPSFGNIYALALKNNTLNLELSGVEGEWIKYDRGSDCNVLVNALKGKGTGWCTANKGTAKRHLKNGDFYVYYSKDVNSDYTQPRIAIRMNGGEIAEIRGVELGQDLDKEIAKTDILEAKLKEFETKSDTYFEKLNDMRKITEIEAKVKTGNELDVQELFFLYEVNGSIKGFGYEKDPRIDEILSKRTDRISDLNKIFRFAEEEGIRIARVNHLMSLTNADGLVLPEGLIHIDLGRLKRAKGLQFHENFDGEIDLRSLEDADGLVIPEGVMGINLSSLKRAKGLEFHENFKGYINLSSLVDADGLVIPEGVTGIIYLWSLRSTKGLQFHENFKGGIDLSSIVDADGLVIPEGVTGIYLRSLKRAQGLEFHKNFKGYIDLSSLEDADGLVIPEGVMGIDLSGLKRAKGLEFHENFNGEIDLSSLEDVDGLVIPESATVKD